MCRALKDAAAGGAAAGLGQPLHMAPKPTLGMPSGAASSPSSLPTSGTCDGLESRAREQGGVSGCGSAAGARQLPRCSAQQPAAAGGAARAQPRLAPRGRAWLAAAAAAAASAALAAAAPAAASAPDRLPSAVQPRMSRQGAGAGQRAAGGGGQWAAAQVGWQKWAAGGRQAGAAGARQMECRVAAAGGRVCCPAAAAGRLSPAGCRLAGRPSTASTHLGHQAAHLQGGTRQEGSEQQPGWAQRCGGCTVL